MSDAKKLNPEIKTVQVGARQLRPVKIYPLSVSDQFELTKVLASAINQIAVDKAELLKKSEDEIVNEFREIIAGNLTTVLEFVCDKGESPTMDELTNNQVAEIITIIFEVNYEGLVKNFKDLFKRGKLLFLKEKVVKGRRTK